MTQETRAVGRSPVEILKPLHEEMRFRGGRGGLIVARDVIDVDDPPARGHRGRIHEIRICQRRDGSAGGRGAGAQGRSPTPAPDRRDIVERNAGRNGLAARVENVRAVGVVVPSFHEILQIILSQVELGSGRL